LFGEKNIPKLIIATPIFSILILATILLYSSIKTQNEYFKKESKEFEKEYIQKQKFILQEEIQNIFNYIEYNKSLMIENIKSEIKNDIKLLLKDSKKQVTFNKSYKSVIEDFRRNKSDLIIYNLKDNSLIKNKDVFFNDTILENAITKVKKEKELFLFDDETDLYYFEYNLSKNIIIIIKKDTYEKFDNLKYSIARWIEFTRFGNNNYFWIHTNTNKLVAHPYRKNDINKDDTYKKDLKGTLFIQKLVRLAIEKENGGYLKYNWPKPNEIEGSKKIAFVKLYKEWNWIIGCGIYIDEIEKVLLNKKNALVQKNNRFIQLTIITAFLLIIFISLLSILISQQINKTFQEYQEKVNRKELKLKDLNQNLHIKIDEAIQEVKEKDRAMLHQSRLARMGEMLNMISHQWRQPLSQLAGIIMEMETAIIFKKVNEKFLLNSTKDATKVIQFMSLTIEDFRNFFKPEKNKEKFYIYKACKDAVYLINDSLNNQNIKLEFIVKNDIVIKGYKREYSQVILNLLVNAKDALIINDIKAPTIKLIIGTEDNTSKVTVEDNAGGIPKNLSDSIFEPYFSTKSSQGTGLGLYMSKMIIEKNMQGKLTVQNSKNGAIFTIIV
jgi:signal transduction histidine kinase